jgi:hypothetical protein
VLSNSEEMELRLLKTMKAARAANDINKELEASRLLRDLQRPTDYQGEIAKDQGFGEAALIGAGRSMSQLGRGIGQLFGADRPQEEKDFEREAYGRLQAERPVATALGESLPYVAGGVGAGAGGLAGGMLRQGMVAGGIGGAMEGAPMERLQNAAIEGATGVVGQGIANAVGRVFAPGAERLAPEVLAQIERARGLGYKVMPTTGTASRGLRQTVQGGLEATPGGAIEFDKVLRANQALLEKAAAASIGEAADAPFDTVLQAARQRIGDTFDAVADRVGTVPVDDQLLKDVLTINDTRVSPMITGPADPVRGVVDQALTYFEKNFERGMSARELMAQQSRIGKAARQAMSGANSNPELGHALLEMQDAMLMALERNAPADVAGTLQQARQQWRALMTLEAGSNIDPTTGRVFPGRLANYLQRRDIPGFTEGANRSPLYEGVRFMGRQQPELPTSGTAERTWLREALKTGAATGLAGAGLGGMSDADPLATGLSGGALGLLGGIVAPNLLARGYLRPGVSNWLSRTPSEAERASMRAAAQAAIQTATDQPEPRRLRIEITPP